MSILDELLELRVVVRFVRARIIFGKSKNFHTTWIWTNRGNRAPAAQCSAEKLAAGYIRTRIAAGSVSQNLTVFAAMLRKIGDCRRRTTESSMDEVRHGVTCHVPRVFNAGAILSLARIVPHA